MVEAPTRPLRLRLYPGPRPPSLPPSLPPTHPPTRWVVHHPLPVLPARRHHHRVGAAPIGFEEAVSEEGVGGREGGREGG
jgi:hypothetical protein